MREDLANDPRVLDGREQAHAPAAARAGEDIEVERGHRFFLLCFCAFCEEIPSPSRGLGVEVGKVSSPEPHRDAHDATSSCQHPHPDKGGYRFW